MRTARFFTSLLFIGASLLTLPAQAGLISSVVVFGDSLSDDGNSLTLAPQASVRYSDGPVAVEHLATALGVPLYNYAVSGAQSGVGNIDAASYPELATSGMSNQVALYLSTPVQHNALHVVFGGANDVLAAIATDLPGLLADPTALISSLVGNLTASVTALYGAGATHFLLPLLPDLGLTPLAHGLDPSAPLLLSGLSEFINANLLVGYQALLADPAFAGADVHIFDTLQAQRAELAAWGAAGGNVTEFCTATAADCSSYFFWDDLHPTSGAHAALAADVLRSLQVPEPAQPALLALALLAAAGVRHRATRR